MNRVARVLVVDDDTAIREAVSARLRAEQYEVTEAADGPQALASASLQPPDLVVLDLMLPGIDGLEVCRRLQATSPVPVLMLTARVDEADRVIGLGVGADDYLTKPFSLRELVARVAALLRRVDRANEAASAALLQPSAGSEATPVIRFGSVTLHPDSRRCYDHDREVHLTPTEFDLMVALASRPGVVFTRSELMDQVWGWAQADGTRTLDSHVRSVRRKLGDEVIRTVHGVGYSLGVGPVDVGADPDAGSGSAAGTAADARRTTPGGAR